MVVYKITNKENGKVYIGITSQGINIRWNQHCFNIKSKKASALKNAIISYGKDAFERIILLECKTRDEANDAEIRLIKEHNAMVPNGYNIRSGGKSASISEYAKQMISIANSKSVERVCPKTGERVLYSSIVQAANQNKITQGSISMCLAGKISSCNGYQWACVGENPKKIFKNKTNRPIYGISIKNDQRLDFESTAEAGRNGFTPNGIIKNLMGHTGQSGGFRWNYVNHDIIKDAPKVRPRRTKPKKEHKNYRPIIAKSASTGEIVFQFESTKEAMKLGFWDKFINHCIAGKRQDYKGLIWEKA